MSNRPFWTLAVLLMLSPTTALAQEAEPLPAPRVVVSAPAVFRRANRYDVWQYYDVDRFGQFRPVVIHGPYSSYYLLNGMCYPWATTRGSDFLRKLVD